jgi:hypothetical protein
MDFLKASTLTIPHPTHSGTLSIPAPVTSTHHHHHHKPTALPPPYPEGPSGPHSPGTSSLVFAAYDVCALLISPFLLQPILSMSTTRVGHFQASSYSYPVAEPLPTHNSMILGKKALWVFWAIFTVSFLVVLLMAKRVERKLRLFHLLTATILGVSLPPILQGCEE